MSGYDIKKIVDVGLSHFWNENYGQIYPTLDRLVRDGLASKKPDRNSGKRQRFVYTITSAGKRSLNDWVKAATDAPVVRNEVLLKFFLCSHASTGKCFRLIESHQLEQRAILSEYQASEAILKSAMQGGDMGEDLQAILTITGSTPKQRAKQLRAFYLTLRHGIRAIEGRLAWCEEALASLECLDTTAAE